MGIIWYPNAMAQVGDMLKQLRVQAGYSQEALSEALDFGQEYVSRIERNKRKPSWRFLVAFANLLHISPNQLLEAAGFVDAQEQDEQIAALIAANPELKDLFDAARDIFKNDPRELAALVRFAQFERYRVLEKLRKAGEG